MKKSILIIGTIGFLLSATPSFAQKIDVTTQTRIKAKNTELAITSPKENSNVTSPLTIEGVAPINSKVLVNIKAVFDGGNESLGSFEILSNNKGKWKSIPINLWAPEGAKNLKYEIVASQLLALKQKSKQLPRKVQRSGEVKVVVTTKEKIRFIARAKVNDKVIREINPQLIIQPEQVQHSTIDPITGERRDNSNELKGSYVSITSPESNIAQNQGVNGKISVEGLTKKRHKVEIRVQSGTVTADNYEDRPAEFSRIIEDWRFVDVNANGEWKTVIDVGNLSYSAGGDFNNDEHHFFTILVRDTNDRSKIKVLHMSRI